MAISFGPKLGLLYNALIGESYFDSLRLFLQSIDQLVNGSIINATQVTPPSSPNPGDAYLLIGGTPGGAWTGQAGNIAVWDAQLTTSGTNNVVPGWVFLVPKAGWLVWNVALASLSVFNGTSWAAIGGSGANFPTNTDITSLVGIPTTNIDTTGYTYGSAVSSGFATGVQIANQVWAIGSPSYTGPGLAVGNGTSTTLIGGGTVQTSYVGSVTVVTEGFSCIGLGNIGTLRVGNGTSNTINSYTPGQPLQISALGNPTGPSVIVSAGQVAATKGQGYLALAGNYWTQTTVGAAGGASAPPATPALWMPVTVNGTNYLQALYAYV